VKFPQYWLVFPALLVAACESAEDSLVASVGSQEIRTLALREFVAQEPVVDSSEDGSDLLDPDAARRQYLQPLIDRYLLLREARERRLDTLQISSEAEYERENILLAALKRDISGPYTPPSESEAHRYYQDHPELFYDAASQGLQAYSSVAPRVRVLLHRQRYEPEFKRLLIEVRKKWAHEVRVFEDELDRALPDSLIERKNVQHGALLSQRGGAFLKQGRVRRALAELLKAVAYVPDSAQTHFYTGLAHARLDDNGRALSAFERAIALDAERGDYHYARGTTLQMLDRYEDAALCFEEALIRQPDQAHYSFRLGESYRALASFDKALDAYGRAIELQSDYVEALYRRSDLRARKGQLKSAAADLDSVLTHRPDHVGALVERARIYVKRERYGDALVALERALALDPSDSGACYLLSQVYAALGQETAADTAAAAFERLTAAERHFNQGIRNANQRYWDRAAALFSRTIEIDPSHLQAHIRLAMVYLYQQAIDKGIRVLERAIDLEPANVEANCLLGEAYAAAGRSEAARPYFARALSLDPKSIRAYYGGAREAYQTGDLERAVSGFQRVLEIDPDHRDSLYFLAMVYLRLDEFRNATRYFQACLRIRPDDTDARYQQGLLLLHYDQNEQAKREFEKVLVQDPTHDKAREQLAQMEQGK